MKKVVRIVWISALTGLAFLSACLTQNGLTRRERKQLMKEREQVEMQLAQCQKVTNLPMDMAFYSEYMEYFDKKYALENKLDSINYHLGDSIDLDRNVRRRQIMKRIDSLDFLIKTYIPPCVYGPPPGMYPDYDEEQANKESDISIWNRQLEEAKAELDDLDRAKTQGPEIYEALYGVPVINYDDSQQEKEGQLQEAEQRKLDSIQRKKEAKRKQDSIRQARQGSSPGCVYGPPPTRNGDNDAQRREELKRKINELSKEINSIGLQVQQRDSTIITGSPEEIEAYRKETDSLRAEANKKLEELYRLVSIRKKGN